MTSSPKAGLLPGGTEFGTEQRLKNALRQDSGSTLTSQLKLEMAECEELKRRAAA